MSVSSNEDSSNAVPTGPVYGRYGEEDQDIAKAVEESLNEQRKQSEPPSSEAPLDASTTAKKKHIEAMVNHLPLRLSNEFDAISDPYGDTIVYLGCPPPSKDRSPADNEHIRLHFNRFHIVHSMTLHLLKSTKFDRLLRPNACIRAEKRLKKLPAYKSISQDALSRIKYHIDMTPPSEDDEAVILLTDLSCSFGIRNWYKAKGKYGLAHTVCMGVDELDTPSNPYSFAAHKRKLSGNPADIEDDGVDDDTKPGHTSDLPAGWPEVSEYSALRHHSGLERLLHAICGQDPKLDSAPKMWTYFALAKFFDCAKEQSVNHWIFRWFSNGANINFIQNNPEIAYRIGLETQSQNLVLSSFSILVGERALIDVCTEVANMDIAPNTSVHGRQLENLDDDERNRIDHAAASLVHRMRKLYTSISENMDWMQASPEFSRLCNMDSKDAEESLAFLTAAELTTKFVKSRVSTIMDKNLQIPFPDFDSNALSTRTFRNGKTLCFERTYDNLTEAVRPFTRTFWAALRRTMFEVGFNSAQLDNVNELGAKAGVLGGRIPVLDRQEIADAIDNVNSLIWKRHLKEHGYDRMNLQHGAYTAGQPNTSLMDDFDEGIPPTNTTSSASVTGIPPNSPKRASAGMNWMPASPEKRRKTSGSEQSKPLPFRPLKMKVPTQNDPMTINSHLPSEISRPSDSNRTVRFAGSVVQYPPVPKSSANGSIPVPPNRTDAPDTLVDLSEDKRVPKAAFVEDGSDNNGPKADSPKSAFQTAKKFFTDSFGGSKPKTGPSLYQPSTDDESGEPVFKMDPDNASTEWDAWDTQLEANHNPVVRDWRPSPFSAPAAPQKPRPMQQFSNSNTGPDDGHRMYTQTGTNIRLPLRVPTAPTFWLENLLRQLTTALSNQCGRILFPDHLFFWQDPVPIDLIDSLVCLKDEEWKFLPLWVSGGCDDGSGGVFDTDVPNLEAGGFRGGKRGIGNVNTNGEGSVSGTDSSFDDVGSEAMSTVGKASKAATDGTETVKSFSDVGSESDFMNQDEIYNVVQEMKMEEIRKGKMRAESPVILGKITGGVDGDFDFDSGNEDDVSTVMGAGSDVQGQFFGGDEPEELTVDDTDDHRQDHSGEDKTKGKFKPATVDSDDEMEIIDKDTL